MMTSLSLSSLEAVFLVSGFMSKYFWKACLASTYLYCLHEELFVDVSDRLIDDPDCLKSLLERGKTLVCHHLLCQLEELVDGKLA